MDDSLAVLQGMQVLNHFVAVPLHCESCSQWKEFQSLWLYMELIAFLCPHEKDKVDKDRTSPEQTLSQ